MLHPDKEWEWLRPGARVTVSEKGRHWEGVVWTFPDKDGIVWVMDTAPQSPDLGRKHQAHRINCKKRNYYTQ